MTLADGDVYADGKIVRKDWPTLTAMAILVDSSQYQPASMPRCRSGGPIETKAAGGPTDEGFASASPTTIGRRPIPPRASIG